MMCIIAPNIVLCLVAMVFVCLDLLWSDEASENDVDFAEAFDPSSSTHEEWKAAFYEKSLTAFASLLAVACVVKSAVFAYFSCRNRCRTCGAVY